MAITGSLSGAGHLAGNLSGTIGITSALSAPKVVPQRPYEGAYEVTPGPEAVVLETAGRAMAENVTINPIPSNYGLISWNGSTLTVS